MTEETTRAEWLARRRTVISGTDIACIVEENPWRSRMDVYMDKTGLADETPDNERMRWGRALEPVIANRFAEEHGVELREPGFLVHPDHPWWGGTPDRAIVSMPDGLEIKTTGARNRDDWGEPGSDQVPRHYLMQCAWYAPLLDVERMHMAVLIGGQEYREYVLPRDLELEAMLREEAERFIRDHLEKQIPPALDAGEGTKRYLAKKYPRDTQPLIVADAAALEAVAVLKRSRETLAQAKRLNDHAEAQVKALIGDAAGLDAGELGKLTWKFGKGRPNYAAVIKDQRVADIVAPLIAEYTSQGARSFRVPRSWGGEEE